MKTVLIKVGSSVMLDQHHRLDELHITHISQQVAALHRKGVGVILVVSGAVACGAQLTGVHPASVGERQAAAGIGQPHLMATLANIFSKNKLTVAQVLLTKDLFESAEKIKNILTLLKAYLQQGVIAIINENDVIDLNSFGGNDFLAAEVAKLMHVDQVLMLSTMTGSKHGVGGGRAKQEAVSALLNGGFHAVILDGKAENVILDNVEL